MYRRTLAGIQKYFTGWDTETMIPSRYVHLSHPVILITASIIYFFTVLNSSGFHHPDEHYQIVQFANYKRGLVPVAEMPWEFREKIRSGMQPLLCYLVFNFLGIFGIRDPFVLALSLRSLMALISLTTISFFIRRSQHMVPEGRVGIFQVLSYFLWFLPYINVRFSSEALSGAVFLIAVALALKLEERINQALLLGAVIGLAILFRYQSAIMALGLLAWLIFVKKEKPKQIIGACAGGLLVLLIGVLVDYWLYGSFILTMYRYFHTNIVEGVASGFGISPWYHLLSLMIFGPSIMIGTLILLALIVITVRNPLNIVSWCCLPFLFVHMIIPHKELRFLFPLANLVPITLIMAMPKVKFGFLTAALLVTLMLINIAGLTFVVMQSTRAGENKMADYIYHHFKNKPVNLMCSYNADPYEPYMHYQNNFYKSIQTKITRINSIWQPDFQDKFRRGEVNLLLVSNAEILGPLTLKKMDAIKARPICTQANLFFGYVTDLYDKDLYSNALTLYIIPYSSKHN